MSEKSELLKLHEDIEYKKDELKNLQHQAVSNKSEELEEKIKQLEIEIKEMEEKKKILLSQTKTIKKKQQNSDIKQKINTQNKPIMGEFTKSVINETNQQKTYILKK